LDPLCVHKKAFSLKRKNLTVEKINKGVCGTPLPEVDSPQKTSPSLSVPEPGLNGLNGNN
jgi:hypothetical protein